LLAWITAACRSLPASLKWRADNGESTAQAAPVGRARGAHIEALCKDAAAQGGSGRSLPCRDGLGQRLSFCCPGSQLPHCRVHFPICESATGVQASALARPSAGLIPGRERKGATRRELSLPRREGRGAMRRGTGDTCTHPCLPCPRCGGTCPRNPLAGEAQAAPLDPAARRGRVASQVLGAMEFARIDRVRGPEALLSPQ
jgi:hypothetical protein